MFPSSLSSSTSSLAHSCSRSSGTWSRPLSSISAARSDACGDAHVCGNAVREARAGDWRMRERIQG
eukprot:6551244-Prymnesium_polylepis.1